jgi:hypothetical protein
MKNAILKTLVVAAMAVSAHAFADVGGDFESKVNVGKGILVISGAKGDNKSKVMLGSSEGNIKGNFKSNVNIGKGILNISAAGGNNDNTLLVGSSAK